MATRIRTQRRWRKMVLAQQASGLNPGAYCSKENICPTSFYAWRKRLGMKQESGAIALLGAKNCESRDPSMGFMQVRPPETATIGTIRIEMPNGYRVAMDDVGQDGLKKLLELLQCI